MKIDKMAIAKKYAAQYQTAKSRYQSDLGVINRSTPDPDIAAYMLIAITDALLPSETQANKSAATIEKLLPVCERADQFCKLINGLNDSKVVKNDRHPLPNDWKIIVHECEQLMEAIGVYSTHYWQEFLEERSAKPMSDRRCTNSCERFLTVEEVERVGEDEDDIYCDICDIQMYGDG